jgi:hypothetical protein
VEILNFQDNISNVLCHRQSPISIGFAKGPSITRVRHS